eukprot:SAG11_NODE_21211_length_429_cov_1.854545_1_plen_69_part_01
MFAGSLPVVRARGVSQQLWRGAQGGRHGSRVATVASAQRRMIADLPSEADCVVVGGGSLGASALYHLQQ